MVSAWSVQTVPQMRLSAEPVVTVTAACPALKAPPGGTAVPGVAVQAWLAAVKAASDRLSGQIGKR